MNTIFGSLVTIYNNSPLLSRNKSNPFSDFLFSFYQKSLTLFLSLVKPLCILVITATLDLFRTNRKHVHERNLVSMSFLDHEARSKNQDGVLSDSFVSG